MWKDDTKKISLDRYKEVQNRFFSHFSSSPGVLRYGTFGSISAPGLSDLDLVVVVEDECLAKKKFSIPDLQGDENYIFTHAPLVIPSSLLEYLHYYHLIDICWADEQPEIGGNTLGDLSTISSFHVLEKTFYLQSFLWGLLHKRTRPCKRTILALTSVARSVQWLQRFSIPVKDSETKFVKSILNLRNDWLNYPNNREKQIKQLESLMLDALKISIDLPESLASKMFMGQVANLQIKPSYRGLQRSPMNFIFEAPVTNTKNIIKTVKDNYFLNKLSLYCGKFQPFIVGKFAFSGPLAYSIIDLDFTLTNEYRTAISGYKWGTMVDRDLQKHAEQAFTETIQKKFDINFKFAKAMTDAGLYNSNFGSVWMPHGLSGVIFKSLAKTIGRARILRRLHTVVSLSGSK